MSIISITKLIGTIIKFIRTMKNIINKLNNKLSIFFTLYMNFIQPC